MAKNTNFYERVTPIHSIREVTRSENYHDVPHDWYIAITDVRGSTQAIEQGRYKDVNALAAASITAVLNAVGRVAIPFVFGGDGATLVVPPETVPQVSRALVATRQLAENQFNLDLRVSIVPVRDVIDAGYRVRVTKLRQSENFEQAIFTGGGIRYAEELVKHPDTEQRYAITVFDGEQVDADFSGFECRWNRIKGSRGEVISLIVNVTHPDPAQHNAIYADILRNIEAIYGAPDERHPILSRHMRLNLLPWAFRTEALIRRGRASFNYLWDLAVLTFKGRIAIWFNIGKWGTYKDLFLQTTDHEKFDDLLRMTISGTSHQGDQLVAYLDSRYRKGELVYGVHRTTHTLVTCLVFDHFGRQVHFVDGVGGGYALAARNMKRQLALREGGAS